MSGEQMQAKITAARREAEGLKDKIKRRKDELADTTRTVPFSPLAVSTLLPGAFAPVLFHEPSIGLPVYQMLTMLSVQSRKSPRTTPNPSLESG